jgi:hypothetical protein
MEKLLDNLKAYILAQVNTFIAVLNTVEVPLISLTTADIITGDCDLVKYTRPNLLFINPDGIAFSDLSISDYDQTLSLDFLFVCRGSATQVLSKRVMRYAAALQELFISDLNLAGVGNMDITNGSYFDGMEGSLSTKGFMLTCTITF